MIGKLKGICLFLPASCRMDGWGARAMPRANCTNRSAGPRIFHAAVRWTLVSSSRLVPELQGRPERLALLFPRMQWWEPRIKRDLGAMRKPAVIVYLANSYYGWTWGL